MLLLLGPVIFVPLVCRAAALFLASLGAALTLFATCVVLSLFQDKYSSMDWRGLAIVVGIMFGVSVFVAWPILYLTGRRKLAAHARIA